MEIASGVHQVDGVTANAYILVRDGLTVIDTGMPGSGKKILSYIRDTLHREPADIGTVVLTYFHTDHIGGVQDLKKAAPGLAVAVHEADAGYVAGEEPYPRYAGLRGKLLHLFVSLRPSVVRPDILLRDGDRIGDLVCIHIPGHTPGSIALLDAEAGCLFAGDILRSDGVTLTEGPAGFSLDRTRERESIRKLADLEYDVLLVGHGKPFYPHAAEKVREFAGTLPASP